MNRITEPSAPRERLPPLLDSNQNIGNPYILKANEDRSSKGSDVMGMGFVLDVDEAQNLITKNSRNKEVLFPFLNGQDLNTHPDQSPSRWIINFQDWTRDQAETYEDCWRIVEERVKPERQRKNEKNEYVLRNPLPQRYWQYNDNWTFDK